MATNMIYAKKYEGRPYYTVLVREDGKWTIHFGDFDKAVAEEELESVYDDGFGDYKRKDLKVIRTQSDQASINNAVQFLNGGDARG